MRTLLVTGGAGFIGSALVRRLIRAGRSRVVNVDKLTYAASPEALAEVADHPNYRFERADIGDQAALRRIFAAHRPDAVVHLAAESHVDRSLDGPAAFIETNIVGTFRLLEEARRHWLGLDAAGRGSFRFLHVSTDEVFGSLGPTGAFSEISPYRPNSPYSASKAASDHLARAWHESFGFPVLVSNCSNNYGPFQFPEKLIPTVIIKALAGAAIPVYGAGENVRDWLHVEDHAAALELIVQRGRPGETYNLGGSAERRNIDVVRLVCAALDALKPRADGASYASQISFVTDRPGHDLRYAMNSDKIAGELGWRAARRFEDGLADTVRWYLDNADWWRRILDGSFKGERLGLAAVAEGAGHAR